MTRRDDECITTTREQVQAAIRELVSQGKLYDTGERRWSERYQCWEIVWCAVPSEREKKTEMRKPARIRRAS
jgi:hypothetical protein